MTSKIKVDNINKVSDDSNIINKCGTTITLGASGDSIALASGASQTGFGREGSVDWQTTIKTGDFTAVSGEGYFINTTSGTITMTLPSSPSVGDIVALKDYANTFDTNNLTIGRNGQPISGDAIDPIVSTEGQAITLVYGDATKGWQSVAASTESDLPKPSFICASVSGACNTLVTAPDCSNMKVATFLGPGTFTVNSISNTPTDNIVSYVVVAGGGGTQEGGGGAGGYREVISPSSPYSGSPLDGYPSAPNRVTVTAQGYSVVVGAGGAVGTPSPTNPQPPTTTGQPGSVSTFATITSAGGGGGGKYTNNPGDRNKGLPGGSGGGSAAHGNPAPQTAGGTGNTPPTTPPQGQNGGPSNGGYPNFGGGGGGAGGVGNTGVPGPGGGAPGGAGVTSSITGSAVGRAGGGGGGISAPNGFSPSPGFGGGNGGCQPASPPLTTGGTANTGGGGGGTWSAPGTTGGSGIVVIRYKFQ